jgi:hypothetical protein
MARLPHIGRSYGGSEGTVQYEVWHIQPARRCRLVGCDRPAYHALIFREPVPAYESPDGLSHTIIKQLPLCQRCAHTCYGLNVSGPPPHPTSA